MIELYVCTSRPYLYTTRQICASADIELISVRVTSSDGLKHFDRSHLFANLPHRCAAERVNIL